MTDYLVQSNYLRRVRVLDDTCSASDIGDGSCDVNCFDYGNLTAYDGGDCWNATTQQQVAAGTVLRT